MRGGIGNQLFIYAAGIFHEQLTKSKVKFDYSSFHTGISKHGNSDLRELISRDEWRINRIMFTLHRFIRRIPNTINRFYPGRFFSNLYESEIVGFDENLRVNLSVKYIIGYFQSHVYLQNIEIRNRIDDLFSAVEISAKNQSYLHFIKRNRTLAFHLRRGDYLNLSKTFGVLSDEYYLFGINELIKSKNFDAIMIFSDDLDAGAKLLEKVNQLKLPIKTLICNATNPIESMKLFSLCDGAVIANSTFSWWGAILGNSSKFVIAPDKWFYQMEDPGDLIPPHWERREAIWRN